MTNCTLRVSQWQSNLVLLSFYTSEKSAVDVGLLELASPVDPSYRRFSVGPLEGTVLGEANKSSPEAKYQEKLQSPLR